MQTVAYAESRQPTTPEPALVLRLNPLRIEIIAGDFDTERDLQAIADLVMDTVIGLRVAS